jgi:hypothetical protein
MDEMTTPLGDLRNHRDILAELDLPSPWDDQLHGLSGLLALAPLREP